MDELDEDLNLAVAAIINANMTIAMMMGEDEGDGIDHRTLPRRRKKKFQHQEALECLQRDYLGPQPLFNDRQFEVMFQISRSRFQRLMEDVAATGKPFYLNTEDVFKQRGSSIEAKLLLPLKSFGYGVPPHTFRDYFQQSETLARKSVEQFANVVFEIYKEEYLRCPMRADLRNILNFHQAVHGVLAWWDPSTACTPFGRIVQWLGKAAIWDQKESQRLFWKRPAITICDSGMRCMDMQDLSMTRQFFPCHRC